jgi:beta-1,3-glucuronyltransferase S
MAGFAVNLNYLAKFPNATMPFKAGYEEDAFLKSIGLKLDDIEPKAKNCTETYVWHTQTSKTKSPVIKVSKDILENTKSNLYALLKSLSDYGVNHFSGSGGRLRAMIAFATRLELLKD